MNCNFVAGNADMPLKAKYGLYSKMYNFVFNLSFDFTRSYVCDKCDQLSVDLKKAKATGDREAVQPRKIEIELHYQKADVFNVQMNEAAHSASVLESDSDTAFIAINFQKNFPIPLKRVCEEYYKLDIGLSIFSASSKYCFPHSVCSYF